MRGSTGSSLSLGGVTPVNACWPSVGSLWDCVAVWCLIYANATRIPVAVVPVLFTLVAPKNGIISPSVTPMVLSTPWELVTTKLPPTLTLNPTTVLKVVSDRLSVVLFGVTGFQSEGRPEKI